MPAARRSLSVPEVTALQTTLKKLGFDPKDVRGKIGPGTKAAVKAFQKSKGLRASGIAGPTTLKALQAAAGRAKTKPVDRAKAKPAALAKTKPASFGLAAAGGGLKLTALKGLVPASVIAQIPETAAKFGITTNLRLAHFLSQCAVESLGFKATVENLNYSAKRLVQVFPKYFRTVSPAAYANNPQKIASRVYANRMGNGSEASGDGFKFRGRGYIQLTGKTNYVRFSKFIGEDCVANPDLVATKYPLASAAFYFNSNKLWAICDTGASNATVTRVTRAVNGGINGLPERLKDFKKFIAALG
jgi:putative chitinase